MVKPLVLSIVAFVAVVTLVAALALLTGNEQSSRDCTELGRDVGAAVLADSGGDQDALVNRAIIVRGNCDPNEQE